jgi:hypothetical protein
MTLFTDASNVPMTKTKVTIATPGTFLVWIARELSEKVKV